MAGPTHYQVMMLDPTATPEVINAVYRVLAKQFHPDHAGPDASAAMARLNEAYGVLGNEAKRAAYDATLKKAAAAQQRTEHRAPQPTTNGDVARAFGRESAPGATNLKFEEGHWTVRPASEPAPPPPEFGEAGAPPAYLPRLGTTISFGRYRGWTINQVAAYDRTYVEWLSRTMAGRTYRVEAEQALAQSA
jgi:curved DNA-binding protein CbpA